MYGVEYYLINLILYNCKILKIFNLLLIMSKKSVISQ